MFIRLRRKSILTFIMLLVVCIIVVTISILFLNKQMKVEMEKAIETIDTDNLEPINIIGYDGEITKDLRLHYYSCIRLNSKLRVGDYIDIRISFANGLDFIILTKKKIMDMTVNNIMEGRNENSLWIYVSEEEILRMSSAMVDHNLLGGSMIYAIKYAENSQESAFANYPVNEFVRKLIKNCPNIVVRGDLFVEYPLRKEIEDSGERIHQPTPIEDKSTYYNHESENTAMKRNIPYEEDIIYLD